MADTPQTTPRLTPREWAITACCAAFLAVQLLLPVAKLFGPRPARFGWQMYSMVRPHPDFYAIAADGSARKVELNTYIASAREDLVLAERVPAHLCGQLADAVAIEHRFADGRQGGTYQCPSR